MKYNPNYDERENALSEFLQITRDSNEEELNNDEKAKYQDIAYFVRKKRKKHYQQNKEDKEIMKNFIEVD